MFPKSICGFGAIAIKIPMGVFIEIDKHILKFAWEDRGPGIVKMISGKKNQR